MRAINVALCFYILVAAGAGAKWQVEVIDPEGGNGYDTLVALDRDGSIHLAYNLTRLGSTLKYARYNGQEWTTVTITKTDEILSPQGFCVDSEGVAHILYFSTEKDPWAEPKLYYGNDAHGSWEIEEVVAEANRNEIASLAVGPEGAPHIAYFDYAGRLIYCRLSVGGWEEAEVIKEPWVDWEGSVSLAVGSDNTPHLIYSVGTYFKKPVKYAVYKDGQWSVDVVDRDSRAEGVSIALDSRGNPHIAYFASMGGAVKYAEFREGRWPIEVVEDGVSHVTNLALKLDVGDTPSISYCPGPKLATLSEQVWRRAVFSDGIGTRIWGASVVDRNGIPHFFCDGGEFKHATPSGDGPFFSDIREVQYDVTQRTAPPVNKWCPGVSLLDPNATWRPAISRPWAGSVYNSPAGYGNSSGEIEDGEEIEILDGRSIWTYDELYAREIYEAWIKVRSPRVEGWLNYFRVKPDYTAAPTWPDEPWAVALVRFTQPCGPLREGPSPDFPAVQEEKMAEDFDLKPYVEAGEVYEIIARCGNWLCVGYKGRGVWVPIDTPGLTFYYLTFGSDYVFYFPVDKEVDRIIYCSYSRFSSEPFCDPILTIDNGQGMMALSPQVIGGYYQYTSCCIFFEAVLPRPINRADINSITFEIGDVEERTAFTVDPRPAWAEYEAKK